MEVGSVHFFSTTKATKANENSDGRVKIIVKMEVVDSGMIKPVKKKKEKAIMDKLEYVVLCHTKYCYHEENGESIAVNSYL